MYGSNGIWGTFTPFFSFWNSHGLVCYEYWLLSLGVGCCFLVFTWGFVGSFWVVGMFGGGAVHVGCLSKPINMQMIPIDIKPEIHIIPNKRLRNLLWGLLECLSLVFQVFG